MDETYYTYGNFTFGIGTFGSGPSFDMGDYMEQIMRNTPNQKIYTTLVEYGDVIVKSSPTVVTGDVKISLDGGSFSDLTDTPTINDSGVSVSLTQAETNASKILILFKDQTVPPEWNDKTINVTTLTIDIFNQTSVSAVSDLSPITSILNDSSYGLSAISVDVNQIPTDNNGITVSASNFVPTDISSLATSAISDSILTGVTSLVNDVIYNVDHSLSALDNKIVSTSAAVKQIPIDNNGITVSASNVISDVTTSITTYGVTNSSDVTTLSNLINSVASQVLSAGVDGSDTVVTVLEKMLAYAVGNINRVGDTFTYYKQDNSTSAFANSATDYDRIRL